MFKSARLELTLWYLAIVMFITLSFSFFVFDGVARNTQRALEAQRRRMEIQAELPFQFQLKPPRNDPAFDVETLLEIRNRTFINLIVINIIVLVVSGGLGYFLAGHTLKPIEEMVKKQKRFISDAAHELKTPLTAMKTSLEVSLRDKDFTVLEAKEALESTIEEVDKLHQFTNRLLKQSKYQNGNGTTKEKVELSSLIIKTVENLKPLSKKKNIQINYDLKEVSVKGSGEELEELFTNLIENAVKYSPKSKPVNILMNTQYNTVIIKIKDEGVGISSEDLPHIFEPFYRADKSRTDSRHEGYGLGLAISKEIIERHNGKIYVESNEGLGTTFTVSFTLSNFSD